MRPWGTYDGDADAMVTGRLEPDLYMPFIYLIFHLHAMPASVDVPARPLSIGVRSECQLYAGVHRIRAVYEGAATLNAQQVVVLRRGAFELSTAHRFTLEKSRAF